MEAASGDDPCPSGQASIDCLIVDRVPGTPAINLSSNHHHHHHRHRRYHRHPIASVVTTSNAYRLMSKSPPPTFSSTVLARSASALHLAPNGDDDDNDDDEATAFVPFSPSSPSSPVVPSPPLPLLRSRSFPAVSAVRKDGPEHAPPLSDRDSIFATHYTDNGSTESDRDQSRTTQRDQAPTRHGPTSSPAGRAPESSPPVPTESMTGPWLEQGRVERRPRPPDALHQRSDSLESNGQASNLLRPPSIDRVDDRPKHIPSTSVTIIREQTAHSAKPDDVVVVMPHSSRAEREADPPVHPATLSGRANIVPPSTYRLWSVGERRQHGTAIEDGPVEKSVSASRPGVELNARSRKTSHSLGLFKENVVSPTAPERNGVPVRPETTRDGHTHRPTDLVHERDDVDDDLDDDDDVVYVREGRPAKSTRSDRRGTASGESKSSRTHSLDARPDSSPDRYARSSQVERGPIPTEHDHTGDQPSDPPGFSWPRENPGALATKDRLLGSQESSELRSETDRDGTPALAPRWRDKFQHRFPHGTTTAGRGPPAGDRRRPRSSSSSSSSTPSDARPTTSPGHRPTMRSRAMMAPATDEVEDEEASSEKDEISSAFYYPRPSPSMNIIEEVPPLEEETAGQPSRRESRSRTREVDPPSTDRPVPVDPPAADEASFRIGSSASEPDLSSAAESEAELGEGGGGGGGDGDATPMPTLRAPAPWTRTSAGDLVAVPPGAVELKPYRHQVGGHTTVFRFSRRAVCKSMSNRENEFYETVERKHPELLTFLPRFVVHLVPCPPPHLALFPPTGEQKLKLQQDCLIRFPLPRPSSSSSSSSSASSDVVD